MVKLLVACIAILTIGLGIRFFFSQNRQVELQRLQTELRTAENRGDWPQVEMLARQWATLEPSNFEPLDAAAGAALKMQDIPLAVEYLALMPDAAPVDAFHELGFLQMEGLNAPEAALETCLRTLQIYPKDNETHHRLLFFYSMTCQRDRLAAEIERAIDQQCDTVATHVYHTASSWLTYVNGYAMNNRWLESSPDNETFTVAAAVHLGFRQTADDGLPIRSEDELQKYAAELERVRLLYPQNIELLAAELELLCEEGDIASVAEALASAPSESGNDHRFWRFNGWLKASQDDWPSAIAAYEQALKLQPLDWQTQTELELAYRRDNQPDAAQEMLRKAILGKKVSRAIQLSPSMLDVPAVTIDEIAQYLALCQQETHAVRLRELSGL